MAQRSRAAALLAAALAAALISAGSAHAATPPHAHAAEAPTLQAQGDYIDTWLLGSPGSKTHVPFDTLYVNDVGYRFGEGFLVDDFVQLDAKTLAVVAAGTHEQIKPVDGTVTIAAWKHVDTGYSDGQRFGSMVWIGKTAVARNGTNEDPGNDNGNMTSSVQGWVRPAVGNAPAKWTGANIPRVQTRTSDDTATSNTMLISGTAYRQTLTGDQRGGWQLVMLDHNGQAVWNQLFPLTGNATADTRSEDDLANTMNSIGVSHTRILQAFGTVPSVPSSSILANAIQRYGGRADVVDKLNATKDADGGAYALISGGSSVNQKPWSAGWTADEASAERAGTGSLSGVLARDPTGNDYIPLALDSGLPTSLATGIAGNQILPLLESGPSSWADWVPNSSGGLRAPTAGEKAALTDIIRQAVDRGYVGGSSPCPAAPDALRAYYCNASATQLSNLGSNLRNNLVEHDDGYSSADWMTATRTVYNELTNASNIRSAIDQYTTIFGKANAAGAVDGVAIGNAISKQVKTSTATSTSNMLNVLSAMTSMASVWNPLAPSMTFLSGAFALVSSTFEPGDTTADLLDKVQTSQATAGVALNTAFHNADASLTHMGDYLVSDPVKLMKAAPLLTNQYALSGQTLTAAQNAGIYAARRFLWGSILAPVYDIWFAPAELGTNPICMNNGNPPVGAQWPFENIDKSKVFRSGIGIGANHQAFNWFPAINSLTTIEEKSNVGLPPSITTPILTPVDPRNTPGTDLAAGGVMPYFALDYLPFQLLPKAPYWDNSVPSRLPGCYANSRPRS